MTDAIPSRAAIRVRPIFAWYDLWVGVFVDRAKRRAYVFPLPCVGLVLSWGDRPPEKDATQIMSEPAEWDYFNDVPVPPMDAWAQGQVGGQE